MTVQALSFLLAAIISAALAVAMLIRDPRNRLYVSFSTIAGGLFLYYLSAFIHGLSGEGFWYRLNILASLGIAPAALRFFTLFLGRVEGAGTRSVRVALTISLILSPFAFSELVEAYVIKIVVLAFVFGALLVCMLMILERLRHTTSTVAAARLKYLLYGGLVAVLFSLSGFLPRVEVPWFPALGNMVTVIYMYFLSQIIIQYRLLDLNELVAKMLVLAALVTVLALVYTLIGFFVTDIPGLIFFNTFIAGFVILILFDPVNRLVEDRVNRLLFRERYEFGRQLATLRRELANVIDVGEMVRLLLQRLENSRRVTGASVYLVEEHSGSLRCLGFVGPPPRDALDTVRERPFLDRLQQQRALVYESLEAELLEALGSSQLDRRDAASEALRVLDELGADICLAIISQERVIGLINVRDDRMSESYSPEEVAHLSALASQAGICVENSHIVTDVRHRDRLAAVGEMAAGLAHEVRNPLGAIKGAAQMLAEEDDDGNGESARDFIEIIVEEVNRLNKVVSDFLDYARPYDGKPGPTDVNQVTERVATLLSSTLMASNVTLTLDLKPNLPPARIDPEVLRQVLWNLCLNAIQAMADSPVRQLTLHSAEVLQATPVPAAAGQQARDVVEITVRDTGPGIAPADLDRIFIPFFTTKEQGTGLGLSICQRLIRAAGGSLRVSTQLGEGTSFSVWLRPFDAERPNISSERRFPVLSVG
jgi:two-component system, NtrC family, sensor histidine kinase HydH